MTAPPDGFRRFFSFFSGARPCGAPGFPLQFAASRAFTEAKLPLCPAPSLRRQLISASIPRAFGRRRRFPINLPPSTQCFVSFDSNICSRPAAAFRGNPPPSTPPSGFGRISGLLRICRLLTRRFDFGRGGGLLRICRLQHSVLCLLTATFVPARRSLRVCRIQRGGLTSAGFRGF